MFKIVKFQSTNSVALRFIRISINFLDKYPIVFLFLFKSISTSKLQKYNCLLPSNKQMLRKKINTQVRYLYIEIIITIVIKKIYIILYT